MLPAVSWLKPRFWPELAHLYLLCHRPLNTSTTSPCFPRMEGCGWAPGHPPWGRGSLHGPRRAIAGHFCSRKDKSYRGKQWRRRLRMAAGKGSGRKGGRRLPALCTFYRQVRDLAGRNQVGVPHPAPSVKEILSVELLSELLRT